jgi:hypothetical protein
MASKEEPATAVARTISVDLVVAVLIFLVGSVVVWGSRELGSSWDSNGPQAGYFPFYIGLLICISSAVILVQSMLRLKSDRAVFVTYPQLKQVMVILLPSFLYVAAIQFFGLYVPSGVFIAIFMKFVGKYSWLRSVIVGGSVSLLAFMMFEIWFKIPLPKGPLERLLGY